MKIITPLENKSCEEWFNWVGLFTTEIKTPGGWLHCGFQIHGKWPAVLSPLHPQQKKAGLNFYKEEHTKNYLISRVGYRISFAKNPESHPQPYVWNNSVQPLSWHQGGNMWDNLNFLLAPRSEMGIKAIGLQTSLCFFHPVPGKEGKQQGDQTPTGTPEISTSGKAFLCPLFHTAKTVNSQIILNRGKCIPGSSGHQEILCLITHICLFF